MAEDYWKIIEPIWNEINIYDGTEVFLDTYSKAPREAALLYAAHFCQSEICNGGFSQFFNNSAGVLAPEAVQGFRVIGQSGIATLIENAMLPLGTPYLRDRDQRQLALEGLPPQAFDNLDEQFFALIETEAGGFEVAANRFADRMDAK
jgi:hypothetical protein